MTSEIERIRDQLRRAVHGEAWHGPSVMEAAARVDGRDAWTRMPPAGHNAVEILLHVASWLEIARERIEGRAVTPTAEVDWPDPALAGGAEEEGGAEGERGGGRADTAGRQAAAWEAARERVRTAHEALDRALAALSDDDLERIAPGKDYPLYLLAHGVVQHSLYHAGQIVLFGRLLAEAR